jgi:hypothetical protein
VRTSTGPPASILTGGDPFGKGCGRGCGKGCWQGLRAKPSGKGRGMGRSCGQGPGNGQELRARGRGRGRSCGQGAEARVAGEGGGESCRGARRLGAIRTTAGPRTTRTTAARPVRGSSGTRSVRYAVRPVRGPSGTRSVRHAVRPTPGPLDPRFAGLAGVNLPIAPSHRANGIPGAQGVPALPIGNHAGCEWQNRPPERMQTANRQPCGRPLADSARRPMAWPGSARPS